MIAYKGSYGGLCDEQFLYRKPTITKRAVLTPKSFSFKVDNFDFSSGNSLVNIIMENNG